MLKMMCIKAGLADDMSCGFSPPKDAKDARMGNEASSKLNGVLPEYYHKPSTLRRIKSKDKLKRSRSSIFRVIGLVMGIEPDVVSLGFPFKVCQKIFVQLSLPDLANCMLVCKEWRSLIDTCHFWQRYILQHYDWALAEPSRWSVLAHWKHRVYSLQVMSSVNLHSQHPVEVIKFHAFSPFPDYWRCGTLVPYEHIPEMGTLEACNRYIKDMNWLRRVREKLHQYKLTDFTEVCMLPWSKPALPRPEEVLAAFGGHPHLIQTVHNCRVIPKSELLNSHGLLSMRYKGPRFHPKFFDWFAAHTGDYSILFDCNMHLIDPAPSFLVTVLSSGYLGGLIYAI
eukprot:GHVU01100800.1.p1 GENE.GHVU01100800.1~~GHVU01100800.1.p1  ORF type:complete len:339 (-),score=17.60 GHVU01100800.1:222-1238(-)